MILIIFHLFTKRISFISFFYSKKKYIIEFIIRESAGELQPKKKKPSWNEMDW